MITLAGPRCRNGLCAFHEPTVAIRQLVLQAPVVAPMSGYHHVRISAPTAEAGSPWSR